jgi:hypothetical protein
MKSISFVLLLTIGAALYAQPSQIQLRDSVKQYFQSQEEPMVKDAIWTQNDIFKVGVFDNGRNRRGYAEYVCIVLTEKGIKPIRANNIWIQVIDINKLVNTGEWKQLGDYRCKF